MMTVLFKKTLFIENLSFRLVRNLSENEGFPIPKHRAQARFTCGNDRVVNWLDVFLR